VTRKEFRVAEVRQIVEDGARNLVIDLEAVTYIDSALIGCLMDIHWLLKERDGAVKLSGLQPRVETMLSMTGVHKIVEVHREAGVALAAFGRPPKQNGDVPSHVAGASSAARSVLGAKLPKGLEGS